MREFSLLDILKYYMKYFWIVLIATFVAELAGAVYIGNIFVPTYKESATIILGKSSTTTEQEISSSTILLYDSLIDNYLKLLDSTKLLTNVKKDLQLNYSIKKLSQMMEYSTSGNSQVIEISVVNNDDELAAKICNQVVVELKTQVYDIYGIDNILVVDDAKASNKKIYSESLIIIITTLLGFGLSSLIIIIKFIFSNKIVYSTNKVMDMDILGKVNENELSFEDNLDSSIENSIRNIRSNLFNCTSNIQKIMISSIEEEDSNSAISYQLAKIIAKANKKVLLINTTTREDLYSGKSNKTKLGLLDVLNNKDLLSKAIIKKNNMDIFTLGNSDNLDLLSSKTFENLLKEACEKYDYILIETSSLKNSFEAVSMLKQVDTILLVSNLDKAKYKDIESIEAKVKKVDGNILGIIFKYCGKKNIIQSLIEQLKAICSKNNTNDCIETSNEKYSSAIDFGEK